jgi:L-threonylcarbamoyladenylate synthase
MSIWYNPSPEVIARAAQVIRDGGLVAFPTETVYGLGANALDPKAVERIFLAKGRPTTSPLIVHVDSVEMAEEFAAEWPWAAGELARTFWPGPLTIVVPKVRLVPDIVTAGLGTVGLRMPNHAVALALIREAALPIAAPSANRFTQLSPTTAEHVVASLGDAVDLVLDAGASQVGLESTVISLCGPNPVLLRPGMVTVGQIEDTIGYIERGGAAGAGPHASPGLHPKHYSPRTKLCLVDGGMMLPNEGRGAYLWLTYPGEAERTIHMPADAESYAASLYRILHELDAQGFDWIAIESPPAWPEWAAIADRLQRASHS